MERRPGCDERAARQHSNMVTCLVERVAAGGGGEGGGVDLLATDGMGRSAMHYAAGWPPRPPSRAPSRSLFLSPCLPPPCLPPPCLPPASLPPLTLSRPPSPTPHRPFPRPSSSPVLLVSESLSSEPRPTSPGVAQRDCPALLAGAAEGPAVAVTAIAVTAIAVTAIRRDCRVPGAAVAGCGNSLHVQILYKAPPPPPPSPPPSPPAPSDLHMVVETSAPALRHILGVDRTAPALGPGALWACAAPESRDLLPGPTSAPLKALAL